MYNVPILFMELRMGNLTSLARKITLVLFIEQSLASAGFIAAATLNPIVGAKLYDHAGWAGVPTAVYLLGAALAAFGWGYVNDLIGRRGGLTLGLLMGVIGSGIAFYSVVIGSFILFLVGMVLNGTAQAAVQLGRFAAAEVHPPEARGRAISNVVIGGTFGSILGPILVGPAGIISKSIASEELAGAYGVSFILFALGVLVVFFGLRPDPRELAREVAKAHPEPRSMNGSARPILQIFNTPPARVALMAMAFGQMVMVLVMVITSLHMRDHQHALGAISMVISAHTFGMFAFSIVSGRLADRFGRKPIILAGSATLVLACIAASLSPDVLPLGLSLFLLGLGWNFCFVGGSTLLADQLSITERGKTQGFNDLMVGMASALGSLSSGIIYATVGYEAMAIISAAVALIPLLAALTWSPIGRQVLQAAGEP